MYSWWVGGTSIKGQYDTQTVVVTGRFWTSNLSSEKEENEQRHVLHNRFDSATINNFDGLLNRKHVGQDIHHPSSCLKTTLSITWHWPLQGRLALANDAIQARVNMFSMIIMVQSTKMRNQEMISKVRYFVGIFSPKTHIYDALSFESTFKALYLLRVIEKGFVLLCCIR